MCRLPPPQQYFQRQSGLGTALLRFYLCCQSNGSRRFALCPGIASPPNGAAVFLRQCASLRRGQSARFVSGYTPFTQHKTPDFGPTRYCRRKVRLPPAVTLHLLIKEQDILPGQAGISTLRSCSPSV